MPDVLSTTTLPPRNVTPDGEWLDLTLQKNSAADLSPTAGHMPRLLGLALASKLFRQNPELTQIERHQLRWQ